MIVRCTDCNAAYSVDDQKIDNKKFGFTCPKCGTSVIIDNRQHAGAYEDHIQPQEEYSHTGVALMEENGSGDFGAPIEKDVFAEEDAVAEKAEPAAGATVENEHLDSLEDIDALLEGKKEGLESPEGGIDLNGGADFPENEDLSKDEEGFEDEPLIVDDFESGLDIETVAEEKGGDLLAGDEHEEDEPLKLEDFETGIESEMPGILEEDAEAASVKSGAAENAGHPMLEEADELKHVEHDIDFGMALDDEKHDMDLPAVDAGADITAGEKTFEETVDADESITIDLDSLDIELEETDEIVSKGLEDVPEIDLDDISTETIGQESAEGAVALEQVAEDDTDTTIDLDTLDITLDEEQELKRGIELDEDERISLDDAGLSLDQIDAEDVTQEELLGIIDESAEEEDIKLTIEEIDPNLSMDDLLVEEGEPDKTIIEDLDEEKLPELDLEDFEESEISVYEPPLKGKTEAIPARDDLQTAELPADDFLDIETRRDFEKYQSELEEEGRPVGDVVPGGSSSFSVDYSLAYSRLGGLLRITGLLMIGLLPRVVVSVLYFLVSSVVSLLNWLLVLFTGDAQDDFLEVQENTLRSIISISACGSGIVEEFPGYTGKKNIDYPLQMNIVYPVRYSRILALVRLSFIGNVIIMLPHLALLALLTLGALLFYIVGIISVIIIKKWPTMIFDFMVRYYRYLTSVLAFMWGIVDRYPSFRFD